MKLLIRYLSFVLLPVLIVVDVITIPNVEPNKQGELAGEITLMVGALALVSYFTKEKTGKKKV